jgi:hypothetical protein
MDGLILGDAKLIGPLSLVLSLLIRVSLATYIN